MKRFYSNLLIASLVVTQPIAFSAGPGTTSTESDSKPITGDDKSRNELDEATLMGLQMHCTVLDERAAKHTFVGNSEGFLPRDDIKELMAQIRLWLDDTNVLLEGKPKTGDIEPIKSAAQEFGLLPCSLNRGLIVFNGLYRFTAMLSISLLKSTLQGGDATKRSMLIRGVAYRDKLLNHLLAVSSAGDMWIGMNRFKEYEPKGK